MWNNVNELFDLVDDARGGRLQVFKRKLKLRLRYVWFRKEIEQLKHYFDSKQLMDLLKADPSMHLKCTRSYLWTGLAAHERLLAQLAFYDWLLSNFPRNRIAHFYKVNHMTLFEFGIQDRRISVQLRPARGLGREGEMAVFLFLDGAPLVKASFTVLPMTSLGLAGEGYAMYVGAFQGERNALTLFKDATRLMERTKPPHLLLNVLQAIAQSWNLQTIVGVSDSAHAFAGYKTTLAKRVKSNYDEIWQELGGERSAKNHFWTLPSTWIPRPESEIESKKRSAYRRRQALRQAFMKACSDAMPDFLLEKSA